MGTSLWRHIMLVISLVISATPDVWRLDLLWGSCKMLTFQFCHPLVIDLSEYLCQDVSCLSNDLFARMAWMGKVRCKLAHFFFQAIFYLVASLPHFCYLDALFSALKKQLIKWDRTSVALLAHLCLESVTPMLSWLNATYHVRHNNVLSCPSFPLVSG